MTVHYYFYKGIHIEIFWQYWGECYASFDLDGLDHITEDFPSKEEAVNAARSLIDKLS